MMQNLICKISCGTELGTGVFLDETHLITALHVLTAHLDAPDEPIYVTVQGAVHLAVPASADWSRHPVTVLTVDKQINVGQPALLKRELQEDDTLRVSGYLRDRDVPDYCKFEMRKHLGESEPDLEDSNVQLIPEAAERIRNFQGFSGAPVLFENALAGVILRQGLEDQTAVRLYAITGQAFRDCLKAQGVELEKPQMRSRLDHPTTGPAAGSRFALREIDTLLLNQFQPIRTLRTDGAVIESRKQLKEFLANLQTSLCTHEQKARFYYTGAMWALFDGNGEEAEAYLRQAVAENSELDTRAYCAYEQIQAEDYTGAQTLLEPVDQTVLLDLLLLCLLREGKSIAEAEMQIAPYWSLADGETRRLLTLIALQSGEIPAARRWIDEALLKEPDAPTLLVCDGLVSYWEAMERVYPTDVRLGFVSTGYRVVSLTYQQKECLERAYARLKQAADSANLFPLDPVGVQALWGLMVVSALLPDRDPMPWGLRLSANPELLPILILFLSDWGMEIPESIRTAFAERGESAKQPECHRLVQLQLYLNEKRYDEALQWFEQHGALIAEVQGLSREEAHLHLLLDCGRLDEAKTKLSAMELPPDRRERCTLGLLFKEDSKHGKDLVKRAVELARKTKLDLDFQNANRICQRLERWKEAEQNAKTWYRETGDLYAQECAALALERQGRCSKALRLIQQAEKLGTLSERAREIKLNCLTGLSRFQEAVELIQTFDECYRNRDLVLFQANSLLAAGQEKNAIRVLQTFIDAGNYDFDVYKQFVSLVQPDDPDQAFAYAHQLYLHEPDNDEYLRFAGYIGMMTGHMELGEKHSALMQADAREGKHLRMATVAEVKELMEETRKQNEEISDLYQAVSMPLHLAVDAVSNGNLGRLYYAMWKHPRMLFAQYGGRTAVIPEIQTQGLILDYTACLTLTALDLLPDLLAAYSEICIPPYLLATWLSDINDLKTQQPHIGKKREALHDAVKQMPYICEPTPDGSELPDMDSYSPTDLIDSACAQKYQAYLIDETPAGVVMDQPVPEEWYVWQIKPEEFYAALEELGLPHPAYQKQHLDPAHIQTLKNRCRIIPDELVLEALLEAEALQQVAEYYELVLPAHTVSLIADHANEYLFQQEAIAWLEQGYRAISKLCESGAIQICPARSRKNDERTRYTQLLEEGILAAGETGFALICDDRFATSYLHVSGKRGRRGTILSLADLLELMQQQGKLDQNKWYQKLDLLVQKMYSFLIPPAEYVWKRLSLCVEREGVLQESQALRSLRKLIAVSLNAPQGLLTQPLRGLPATEFTYYILNLSHVFSECLQQVWNSEHTETWKGAASDWLLMVLGETLCDIQKEHISVSNWMPTKLASLICEGIHLVGKQECLKAYFSWVFSYVYAACCNRESLKKETAARTASLVATMAQSELPEIELKKAQWEDLRFKLMVSFLIKLPADFLSLVLKDPNLKEYAKVIRGHERHFEQSAFEGPSPAELDERILSGNEEDLERVILEVTQAPETVGSQILELFANKNLSRIEDDIKYRLARFLFHLSWYVPQELRYKLQERKRALAIWGE